MEAKARKGGGWLAGSGWLAGDGGLADRVKEKRVLPWEASSQVSCGFPRLSRARSQVNQGETAAFPATLAARGSGPVICLRLITRPYPQRVLKQVAEEREGGCLIKSDADGCRWSRIGSCESNLAQKMGCREQWKERPLCLCEPLSLSSISTGQTQTIGLNKIILKNITWRGETKSPSLEREWDNAIIRVWLSLSLNPLWHAYPNLLSFPTQ